MACNMKSGLYCNLMMAADIAGVNITIHSPVITDSRAIGQATSHSRGQDSNTAFRVRIP
jgi:hypothetical protein